MIESPLNIGYDYLKVRRDTIHFRNAASPVDAGSRSFSGPVRRPDAGFTMIEALVALALVAVLLAAIGSLAAFNIRGTARLERQLAMIGATRTVLTTLTTGSRSGSDARSGEIDSFRWQALSRLPSKNAAPGIWTPRTVSVVVRSPDGRELQLDTIRLQRLGNNRG